MLLFFIAARKTRTFTELPRLEPESSASTNSAIAAEGAKDNTLPEFFVEVVFSQK